MVVPTGKPAGLTLTSFPPANSRRVPSASDSSRVSRSSRETAAIVGSASPRKPSVEMESRSSADFSLLVAWRSKARSASSCVMPWPSSITRIMRLPPTSVSTRMVFAPASSAFSNSSFTTEAGRSTTSPAAILFATASGKMRMRLMILCASKREESYALFEKHNQHSQITDREHHSCEKTCHEDERPVPIAPGDASKRAHIYKGHKQLLNDNRGCYPVRPHVFDGLMAM